MSSENITLVTSNNFSVRLFCSRPAIKLVKFYYKFFQLFLCKTVVGCVRVGFQSLSHFCVFVVNDCVFFEILVVWVC